VDNPYSASLWSMEMMARNDPFLAVTFSPSRHFPAPVRTHQGSPEMSNASARTTQHTVDAVFGGALTCEQSVDGYRFTIDAILLAHRVAAAQPSWALEIGAGCGVISLALAHLWPGLTRVDAVEVQASLYGHLTRNIERNQREAQIKAHLGDIRELTRSLASARYDVVFMNPPYHEEGHGRLNPHPERAAARHQQNGSLAELVQCACTHLRPDGALILVYPATALARLSFALDRHGLGGQSVRCVHPFIHKEARLVLVTARTQRRLEMRIEAPLTLYDAPERYSEDVQAALAGTTVVA